MSGSVSEPHAFEEIRGERVCAIELNKLRY
jgi:hypothetical protein